MKNHKWVSRWFVSPKAVTKPYNAGLAVTVFSLIFAQGMAQAKPENACDQAARIVSDETGVPLSVLEAITRVETGTGTSKGMQPWPWTVNMEGKGKWFETEDEARAYVFKHFKRGARSFDVGCFQINYKWHGQSFSSIDQMFDPLENARYAARFLKKLYTESGDWVHAAGAYHSRNPVFADKYKARFERFRSARLRVQPGNQPTSIANADRVPAIQVQQRRNDFPFLIAGAQAGLLGSLVPAASQSGAKNLLSTREEG